MVDIYASDLSASEMPSGIDELTNIYLQEGNYNGASKQSYKSLNNQQKPFSDYLSFQVDPINQQTVINWNIPRQEGQFGNALWFSNIAEANWYMTFSLKGYPYFRHGRGGGPYTFQIVLSSETQPYYSNFYTPTLPKIKLGYHCDSFRQQAKPAVIVNNSSTLLNPDPVYINGVRYQLTKQDFTPIYEAIVPVAECGIVNVLTGYQIDIPVQGDTGQQLIFDINGRSGGKTMKLSARCGNFSANDTGDKYVITQTMATNSSCTNMQLTFAVNDGVAAANIDLNLQISEMF